MCSLILYSFLTLVKLWDVFLCLWACWRHWVKNRPSLIGPLREVLFLLAPGPGECAAPYADLENAGAGRSWRAARARGLDCILGSFPWHPEVGRVTSGSLVGHGRGVQSKPELLEVQLCWWSSVSTKEDWCCKSIFDYIMWYWIRSHLQHLILLLPGLVSPTDHVRILWGSSSHPGAVLLSRELLGISGGHDLGAFGIS